MDLTHCLPNPGPSSRALLYCLLPMYNFVLLVRSGLPNEPVVTGSRARFAQVSVVLTRTSHQDQLTSPCHSCQFVVTGCIPRQPRCCSNAHRQHSQVARHGCALGGHEHAMQAMHEMYLAARYKRTFSPDPKKKKKKRKNHSPFSFLLPQ